MKLKIKENKSIELTFIDDTTEASDSTKYIVNTPKDAAGKWALMVNGEYWEKNRDRINKEYRKSDTTTVIGEMTYFHRKYITCNDYTKRYDKYFRRVLPIFTKLFNK